MMQQDLGECRWAGGKEGNRRREGRTKVRSKERRRNTTNMAAVAQRHQTREGRGGRAADRQAAFTGWRNLRVYLLEQPEAR